MSFKMPLLDGFYRAAYNGIGTERIPEGKGGHVFVDGTLYRIKDIKADMPGDLAFAFGVNEAELEILGRHLDVVSFAVKGLRTTTLQPITAWRRMTRLKLWWVQKLADLSPLAEMDGLDILILDDIKHAADLSPVAQLAKLRALAISGGMWSTQHSNSLEPLTELPKLEELRLAAVKTGTGGLRVLVGCKALKRLWVPFTFDTADYAYLAAHRPDIASNGLKAVVPLRPALGDKDVMVVGKRKPMLNRTKDAARIAKYEAAFADLVAAFQADPMA